MNEGSHVSASADQLIAIDSFFDVSSGAHGAMVRLKLPDTTRPNEPNEPKDPGEVTAVEVHEKPGIQLFPNPATDRLYVRVSRPGERLSLFLYGPTGSRILGRR